ncbi:DUF4865 family protein [Rhodanobacter sp. 7MK24]|uniref:DUF4865 family protein n=1 Tax=Rhodanobacter sp. 7MK24 TaxID=2775922 RepID=UPI0017860F20|nr:DUF4865 family protein [Rhodanobacter sp. 7MK24]MBD8879915.1 DUF4865 family protein [Rhodanobacter sp. 7MK24]
MIAMQYTITLPAGYDMAIIRRRIADKGHLLDDFPGLGFKAWLYALCDDGELPGRDNLYAPFYLWRDSAGMNAFLNGAGFAALSQDFGRPAVRNWIPWQAELVHDLRGAVCATREIAVLPDHADLAEWQRREEESTHAAMAEGALAAITACNPADWTLARFRLWPEVRADLAGAECQAYRVGHISQPR